MVIDFLGCYSVLTNRLSATLLQPLVAPGAPVALSLVYEVASRSSHRLALALLSLFVVQRMRGKRSDSQEGTFQEAFSGNCSGLLYHSVMKDNAAAFRCLTVYSDPAGFRHHEMRAHFAGLGGIAPSIYYYLTKCDDEGNSADGPNLLSLIVKKRLDQ